MLKMSLTKIFLAGLRRLMFYDCADQVQLSQLDSTFKIRFTFGNILVSQVNYYWSTVVLCGPNIVCCSLNPLFYVFW